MSGGQIGVFVVGFVLPVLGLTSSGPQDKTGRSIIANCSACGERTDRNEGVRRYDDATFSNE
ncbi:hypothetical protein [Haladaptatus caseinilyticus]|uniref:hypothetical protein n=1 Tax=Haladaptatus caseinilyticus TaxID=2993314 RepID=UPI00224AF281|nr:hypothetical protein [Haladaptatus caseinilyticus]